MGALYHLKQKLVDFCNVIQENVSRTDTVPSSKVVYDLKADTDTQIGNMTIKSKVVNLGTVTTQANGYVSITSFKPTGMNNFLFAQVDSWGSTNPVSAFCASSSGIYVFGAPNMTITDLRIKYFYTD